jgi:hypothetical protein
MDYLGLDDQALIKQCSLDVYRASGPGGQKRNKTSSAVRLRHQPTGLIVIAEEDRSQHVNRARALRRMREAIALHVRRSLDISNFQPSSILSSCIVRGGQLRINARNEQFPIVVAEVLDVMAACGMRVGEAAKLLGLSTSQLVAFIERNPKLWDQVNQMRTAAGVKTLR